MAGGDTDIDYRPAQPGDHEAWLAMRMALWPHGQRGVHLRQMQRLREAGRSAVCLVAATAEGRLAGFVELSTRATGDGCLTSPVAYIDGIYVSDGQRRNGVAGGLLAAAERWAVDCGLLEITSHAQLANEASQAWHQACGFDEISRTVAYRKTLSACGAELRPVSSAAATAVSTVAPVASIAVAAAAAAQVMAQGGAPGDRGAGVVSTPTASHARPVADSEARLLGQFREQRRLGRGFYMTHAVLLLLLLLSLSQTSVYSSDLWRGAILPCVDIALVVYLLLVLLWWNRVWNRRR